MLRSLWLSMIYGMFLFGGLVAPFALGLGYVWVDTFSPQHVAYSILTDFPVSLIMGAAMFGAYLLTDRRYPPRLTLITALIVAFGCWVTFTTLTCAVAPEVAWPKWNWAIKTMCFATFMPFLFRSRIQIEAFLQVYLFSAAIQIVPYGAKTLISGGSYHANLALVSGNSGLAEGSTLATVAIMSVPLALWLRKHTLIFPRIRLIRLMYLGLAIAAISASIGTVERTGLVAIVVVAIALWLQSQYKIRWALVAAALVPLLLFVLIRPDSDWAERMSTITDYNQESSSLGRILVWEWTLKFVQSHPFGGGFNAYVVDTVTFPGDGQTAPVVVHGKAFHSMYFEVLGEHGWVGLGLFLSLLGVGAATLLRVARKCRGQAELAWCRDLALALLTSEAVLAVSGCFIGIAFQTEVYYLFATITTLASYVRRVEHGVARTLDFPALNPDLRAQGAFIAQ
jgi:putative inorganic carbon (HCO3(-)) transporter